MDHMMSLGVCFSRLFAPNPGVRTTQASRELACMSARLRAPLGGADEDDACAAAAMKVRFEDVVRAQSEYEAARAAVRAYDALSTLARGREERRSRRALGLIDERWSRHCARMSLVELGFQTALSPLYHLPRDVRSLILVYVLRASVVFLGKKSQGALLLSNAYRSLSCPGAISLHAKSRSIFQTHRLTSTRPPRPPRVRATRGSTVAPASCTPRGTSAWNRGLCNLIQFEDYLRLLWPPGRAGGGAPPCSSLFETVTAVISRSIFWRYVTSKSRWRRRRRGRLQCCVLASRAFRIRAFF